MEPLAQKRFDVIVYEEDCKSCGLCIDLCPRKVFQSEARHLKAKVVALDACTGCGLCELLCPDWAISVEKREKAFAAAL